MDKRKLVNIIIKDLEEIKVLSEEVAESEDDNSLIIDIALNRARLICQEIGLLRELNGNSIISKEETYQVSFDKDEEERTDFQFPDPELEILNFEDRDFSDDKETYKEEDLEGTGEEDMSGNLDADLDEEDDDLMEEDDDLLEIEEEEHEEIRQEDSEDHVLTREETLGKGEEILGEEEEDIQFERAIVEKEKIQQPETNIQVTELRNDPQPGFREINIDDLDDGIDDIVPLRFTPPAAPIVRPPMREIPKPEFLEPESPEKLVMGEKFQKERSLNDTLAEKQAMESKLNTGKISSLRAAIGLNDRFLFIREIFNNNTEKYNAVIEHLDKLEQISEAVEYLKANLSMQKNEASMKFVDLLKRRFTP